MRNLLPAILLLLTGSLLWGQGEVRITGFVPGNYRFDEYHRVELSNMGSREANLGGWLVVTRDYSVVLPANARIPAGGRLALVKRGGAGPGVIELSRQPDFLIRFPDKEFEGNYVVLFNREQRITDAFLYSPLREVPYLPDNDTAVTSKGIKIPFYLPVEKNGAWQYLQGRDDPAIAFERQPEGWRIVSRKKLLSSKQALVLENLTLRYQDGIVTLRWVTRGSRQPAAAQLSIQRSEDQEVFVDIGSVEISPGITEMQHSFFDPKVQEGKTYYYRVVAIDGNATMPGEVKEIKVEQGQADFDMEVFPGPPPHQREISVRFYSGYSQKIRIKVMDARFREVAVVFDGFVNARSRSLVKLREELPPGTYRIFAQTETRRYVREVVVK